MKLHSITISEVLGLSRADINFAGITLVAGNNAAGKSSLADCISMAFLGTPARVSLKKELDQLLHDDASKGRITVNYDGGEGAAEFRLPKGEHHADQFEGMQYLPYVLSPKRFAGLTADERRTLLFQLSGCKASSKVIIQKLVERGIDENLATDFAINWKTGFPAAAKEAYARATAAKGAWGQITGQKWGSVVAEDWKAPKPEGEVHPAKHLEELLAKVGKHQDDLENGIKFIGQQEEALKAAEGRAGRIAALTETHGLLKRRETKLKTDQDELTAWEEKFPALKKTLDDLKSAGIPVKCPCCDEELSIVGGTLQKFEGMKADTKALSDAALAVTNAKAAIDLLKRTIENDVAAVAESTAAGEEIQRLNEEGGAKVDQAKLDKARESVEKLRQIIADLRTDFNAKQEARVQAVKVDELTAKAAAAHAEVKTWLAVGDALSPDGIPADLLADAMAPINQSLAVLARLCRWKSPTIQADMSICYGERLYGLCSASEQWRTDALIAMAIAQISQLRLVVLDGFDILHAAARQELLGMCMELDKLGAMETQILCGTMKELPAGLSKRGIAGVWVNGSIAENAE